MMSWIQARLMADLPQQPPPPTQNPLSVSAHQPPASHLVSSFHSPVVSSNYIVVLHAAHPSHHVRQSLRHRLDPSQTPKLILLDKRPEILHVRYGCLATDAMHKVSGVNFPYSVCSACNDWTRPSRRFSVTHDEPGSFAVNVCIVAT
jgi:hypothetical protein